MDNKKVLDLLDSVVENYIDKGDPIGSKFLHSLEGSEYAPSTLRKYLNLLEKEGLLYQPYHSSGRVPTVKGLSAYLNHIIEEDKFELAEMDFNVGFARNGLKFIVEGLGKHVDGVVVGFLRNDEYFYLGIQNLLPEQKDTDYETIRFLVKYIEEKKLIKNLDEKMIRKNHINYTFIEDDNKVVSCIYTKLDVNGYDCVISVLGPARTNYKKNLSIMKNFLKAYYGV